MQSFYRFIIILSVDCPVAFLDSKERPRWKEYWNFEETRKRKKNTVVATMLDAAASTTFLAGTRARNAQETGSGDTAKVQRKHSLRFAWLGKLFT